MAAFLFCADAVGILKNVFIFENKSILLETTAI